MLASEPVQAGTATTDGLTAAATVHASAAVVDDSFHSKLGQAPSLRVHFQLYGGDGTSLVADGSGTTSGTSGSVAVFKASLTLPRAQLWSIGRPYLYTLVSELTSGAVAIDRVNATIGIRSLNYTGSGFYMNAQHLHVRGFCDHESWGGVQLLLISEQAH
eukprot:SAG22_NODE_1912_length_3328_cov_1.207185_2_plen_160_part_00